MKRFINNWPFKILSLILSIILWLYVAGELERRLWLGTKEVTLNNIPIKILGLPGEEFKVEVKPNKTDIVLYGYKNIIENIDREDITLFVDLGNFKSGTYELYIRYIIPKEFNISQIDPPTAMVTILEKSISPSTSNIFLPAGEQGKE